MMRIQLNTMFAWVVRGILLSSLLATSSSAMAAAKVPDKRGCTDHPMFPNRIPGYHILDCKASEFDAYEFFVQQGPKHREEGKYTYVQYNLTHGETEQSGLAVVRNYQAALEKIGGKVANINPQYWVNGSVTIAGKEVWVQVEKTGSGQINIRTIEKAPMQQHIVADAKALSNDIAATGHVAVEGIYFDTGKAALKPESTPALLEVAKMLKANASFKYWVVGHTDTDGRTDDNQRLAEARARAVVAVLVSTYGIPAARLEGYGVGPLAPVATNDTEDGKAKNRRVELVKH
jgi:outer membrane protein OmpA-like peptidoglycan-associated protein